MLEQNITGRTAVNIAGSVEAALAAGKAAAGEILPSVRGLAAHLGVSGATVAAAYRMLQERGVVTAERRRGTRIRPAAPVASPGEEPLPKNVRDLATGNPDRAFLPHKRLYREGLNDPQLVRTAARQFAAEGVPSAHIAVVSGALDGIERALREQLRAGDRVVVEDPCFTGVLDLLYALALVPVPVPVDDEGLLPGALQAALRDAKALIVTPRAQNPTGAAMTPRRGRALRTLLDRRPELLLLEDDHAGPVAGAQYVTLVDAARARWAVVRSVSKSLGPDLRVALLAGDAATIARVEGRQTLGIRWVSHLLQTLVAALWCDKRTQRQLVRAERAYTERRRALLAALHARGIEAHGLSGLNVWIPLPEESGAVQALMRKGWAVKAGERYRIRSEPAVRVTIASLEPRDAVRFAEDLAALFGATRRSSAA